MDPASAIGVAAGVIAFIDASYKIIKSADELYRSENGSTKENAQIGKIVEDLKEYSLDLSTSHNYTTKHERAIEALAKDCATLSDEIIEILERLKLSKKSRRRSFAKIWSTKQKKNEIAALEGRLGEYRAQINLRLMAAMK